MLGFKPRISGVGSNDSTNWATTTALLCQYLRPFESVSNGFWLFLSFKMDKNYSKSFFFSFVHWYLNNHFRIASRSATADTFRPFLVLMQKIVLATKWPTTVAIFWSTLEIFRQPTTVENLLMLRNWKARAAVPSKSLPSKHLRVYHNSSKKMKAIFLTCLFVVASVFAEGKLSSSTKFKQAG